MKKIPMPEKTPPKLFGELADRLRDAAEGLTDEWLERLGERLGVRPRRLLPTRELRDHVPAVLLGAADSLDAPRSQLPNETVPILRTLAQLRREQGYDIQEILTEVDILSDLVFDRAAEWTEEIQEGAGGAEAWRAAARLSAVFRSIASVAVGTYREEELRQDQELADRLGDFASMINHELRSPLNTAGLSAEMLSDEEIASDPELRAKHAGRIRDGLDRIQHLLGDLHALAVAEGARAEPRWVSVREVTARLLDELHELAERQNVDLRVEPPDQDFKVDASRVEIALVNLVANGIKFSDPEKEDRWVEVRFGAAESEGLKGGRRIIVEDNGRGISPGSQNKVFQRFFREYPGVEGTGLGLDIAKRVVEQRGGLLWFESEPGEGTTFFMEIPQRLERSGEEPGEVTR